MSASTFQSDMANARTSILAEDWDTALNYLEAAWASLAALPDSEQGANSLKWRDDVEKLVKYVEQKKAVTTSASNGGIQYKKTQWVATTP